MLKCGQCGGKLRRVHRTFGERFRYMAIYACRDCKHEEFVARRYRYHFGPHTRCPNCGTFRVVRLRAPDKIVPMFKGFFNFIERISGGSLFHCRYCRVQFFDRRKLASDDPAPASEVTARSDKAKSGA